MADHRIDSRVAALPDGHMRIDVENEFELPVTALAVVGSRSLKARPKATIRSIRFFDPVLSPMGREREINKGDQYSVVMFGPKPAPDQLKDRSVRVTAAIFSDGSTWGDPKWIGVLMLRRQAAYRFESEALQIVMDAKVRSMDPPALLQLLKSTEQELVRGAKTPPERQLAGSVFEEVVLLVQDALDAQLNKALVKLPINSPKVNDFTNNAVARLTFRMRSIEMAKPPIASASAGMR